MRPDSASQPVAPYTSPCKIVYSTEACQGLSVTCHASLPSPWDGRCWGCWGAGSAQMPARHHLTGARSWRARLASSARASLPRSSTETVPPLPGTMHLDNLKEHSYCSVHLALAAGLLLEGLPFSFLYFLTCSCAIMLFWNQDGRGYSFGWLYPIPSTLSDTYLVKFMENTEK